MFSSRIITTEKLLTTVINVVQEIEGLNKPINEIFGAIFCLQNFEILSKNFGKRLVNHLVIEFDCKKIFGSLNFNRKQLKSIPNLTNLTHPITFVNSNNQKSSSSRTKHDFHLNIKMKNSSWFLVVFPSKIFAYNWKWMLFSPHKIFGKCIL